VVEELSRLVMRGDTKFTKDPPGGYRLNVLRGEMEATFHFTHNKNTGVEYADHQIRTAVFRRQQLLPAVALQEPVDTSLDVPRPLDTSAAAASSTALGSLELSAPQASAWATGPPARLNSAATVSAAVGWAAAVSKPAAPGTLARRVHTLLPFSRLSTQRARHAMCCRTQNLHCRTEGLD
jgi:hypothetical protein